MYVILVRLTVKEGEEAAVEEAIRQFVQLSRREPWTTLYFAHRSHDNPRQFMYYEQYPDESAYQAHRETPYYRKYVHETILPRIESRELTAWSVLPAAPEG